MGLIPITFNKGLNLKTDPLGLKEGELVECEGFSYRHNGYMECRPAIIAVNDTAISSIHTLYRYINWVLCGDGYNLRYKWDLDGYCNRYIPPDGDFTLLTTLLNANRLRIVGSDLFCFMVNGQDKKAFTNVAIYDWHIPNPILAPTGVAGAVGNPNGTYSLYYTWVVKFPNGYVYETGPSPAGSVTVTSDIITWGGITPCPYSGTGLIIHRKLYRYSTTLDEYYLVTTIEDNTTTTYSDNETDATLQTNSALTTTDYVPPPDGMTDICEYLNRIWGIKDNMLYWSESYIPFTFPAANSIQVSIDGENLTALMPYSDQLMIASPRTWYRLQGRSADTWEIRNTFAEVGSLDPHTVKKTRYGIISRWQDGLYLFNGNISQPLTLGQIGTEYFTDIDDDTKFGAEWDGVKYSLLIPSLNTSNSNSYVKALFHFDGVDASTAVPDSSENNYVLTLNGAAQLDTAQKVFGTASLYLADGNNDWASLPAHDSWHMAGGLFSIAMRARLVDVTRVNGFFSQRTDNDNYVICQYVYSGGGITKKLQFSIISGGSTLLNIYVDWTPVADTWYALEVIRGWSGNPDSVAVCIDGAAVGTGTMTGSKQWPALTGVFYLGLSHGVSAYRHKGWIDEFIIFKGLARKTAAYTPEASAFSINSYTTDPALPENVLVADFSTYPAVRFYDDNINVYADYYHVPTGIKYLGHKDGYQYEEGGSETIATTLWTGDKGGNEVLQLKTLEYLYYEIDTNSIDVTVTIYVDGTAQTATVTLNNSARTRGRKDLPRVQGYRFSLKITCADSQHLKIYEPWGLSYTASGE